MALTVLCSFIASTSFAANEVAPAAAENSAVASTASDSGNIDENWYWGMNLGVAGVRYKGPLKTQTDLYQSGTNNSHAGGYFDLYFMWPLANKKTAIGPSLSSIHDRYESSTTSDLSVTTTLIGGTIQHFFTSNIGEGFFGRVDMGLARTSLDNRLFSTSSPTSSSDYEGFGARLGLGFSLPVSNTTRMPFTAQWQHTSTEGDSKSNSLILTVGVLF